MASPQLENARTSRDFHSLFIAAWYFVYDPHKSGAQTVSHLRFGPDPIRAPYLIGTASFVACHQFNFLERQDVLRFAAPGATFLLNSIHLGIMTVLMFIAMYILMYAMVDRIENVFPHINQFYMAGLMTAPMVPIQLAIMRSMYENRVANIAIVVVSLIALVGCWTGIRQQVAVTDTQFVKSMIPHHAGAILMCEKASPQDAELQSLCQGITRNQQSEPCPRKSRRRA